MSPTRLCQPKSLFQYVHTYGSITTSTIEVKFPIERDRCTTCPGSPRNSHPAFSIGVRVACRTAVSSWAARLRRASMSSTSSSLPGSMIHPSSSHAACPTTQICAGAPNGVSEAQRISLSSFSTESTGPVNSRPEGV